MALNTDLDNFPYWDDYVESKKYHRVLFRPTTAIQARELTQLQTILQNQIERFGNHVFKDGSVVRGCNPVTLPNLDFVRVEDNFLTGSLLSVTEVDSSYLLVGQTSGVRAVTVICKNGLFVNYPDTNRFYVRYIKTGNNEKTVFDPAETIAIYNLNQLKLEALDANNLVATIKVINTSNSTEAVGKGYGLSVDGGIVYHKGFFQLVDPQTVLVKAYDQTVGGLFVGFDSYEELITENEDPSLADNALGYPNENAPGAHRLKLDPYLVVKEKTDVENNQSFFAVFEFSNVSNDLIINRNKDSYDKIGEVLANRTFEESGDYVTKPFVTDTTKGDTPNTFYYTVSSGIGYVRGNRVEYLSSRKVEAERAMTTKEVIQQSISTNYGNFVYVNEYSGALNFTTFPTVYIYGANSTGRGFEAVSSNYTPDTSNKTKIGTAKVKAVLHHEGDPGSANTTYRLYLSDIKMDSGKSFTTDARSIYANTTVNSYGLFYADLVRNSSSRVVLQEPTKPSLVFPINKSAVKTLRSANGSVNASEFYYRTSTTATMQTDGKFAVTVASPAAGGIEELGYSLGTVGDVSEDQFIITVTANVSTTNVGTVNITSGNTKIAHASTLQSKFATGEFIKIFTNGSGAAIYGRVTSVNTSIMEISPAPTSTNAAAQFAKHFPAGYSIPMDNSYAGGSRVVNVTSATTFDVDTDMDAVAALESTVSVIVQYKMRRSQATQAKKEVAKNRFVKLFANANINGTWNLGLPDVFKIRKVYLSSTYTTANSADVTSYFALDNGQKPDYYDHSKLVLRPEYSGTLGNNLITVELDHFVLNTTNGAGFFSVDSYPVDDANTSNTFAISTEEIPTFNYENISIKLRDAVDFRPYKVSTAASAASLAAATENPTTTTSFVTASVKYVCEPDTNFQADLEYYLGRKDLITINTAGALGVVKGTPSENPRVPQNNADSMIIAMADVPPYPSLSYEEAVAIGLPNESIVAELYSNRVYTMRDIGVLDTRIENLEYYTSLAALEIAAKDLAVLDENGLNRFKNGIFVDPMSSYDFHDYTNAEYKFTLDITDSYGRSTFNQADVDLEYKPDLSSGVKKTGRYLTMPFTEERLISQPFSTKYRNNAQDIWRWNGNVNLFPGFEVNTEIVQGRPRTSSGNDVEFRIFMNSRNVCFVATGLRPNTRIYPFFDSTAVSAHCAPAAINTEFGTTVAQVVENSQARGRAGEALVRTANFGTALTTDATGTLLGIFRIPPDTFRVGDRVFRVCDVDNLTLGEDAILTQASVVYTGFNVRIVVPPPPPPPPPIRIDPLAQSFNVDAPEGQTGIFVTKIELFFRKKDPNLGLEVIIVGMDAGVPNFRDFLGRARLESSQVLTSEDGSLGTLATFDFPVYLPAGKQYAFYVKPDGNSPEYQMWVCEIGDFDTVTGVQVFRNPYAGDLFRSSNEQTWSAYPTEDAKFNLFVANFDVGTGYAYFENEYDDYLTVSNTSIVNPINPISYNNEVYRINSQSDITIVTGYADSEGYVQQFKSTSNTLILNNSKGAFRAGQVIGIFNPPQQGNSAQCNSSTLIATAVIDSVDNKLMHSLLPKLLSTTPSGTSVNLGFRAASAAGSMDSDYIDVVSNNIKELTDYERVVFSHSNEQAASLAKTFSLRATLNNSNKYLSPILDLESKTVISIENVINDTSANEYTGYGSALARYISKPVTLTDGQDAEDFLLYLTGYRPVNTDVKVFVRFLSSQDPGTLDSKVWTELTLQNPGLRSSSVNNVDWKEFVYGLPVSAPNPQAAYKPIGQIMRYTDTGGAVYETYISFVIKIVLTSSNKIFVPKIKDIRAIALQL